MKLSARRQDQSSKRKAKKRKKYGDHVGRVSSQPTADPQQSSSTVGVYSILRNVLTWLRHATVTLKQSIMGNRSWLVALLQIGLWLLLLWVFSNLHMGLPCFVLTLVFWLYRMYG